MTYSTIKYGQNERSYTIGFSIKQGTTPAGGDNPDEVIMHGIWNENGIECMDRVIRLTNDAGEMERQAIEQQ